MSYRDDMIAAIEGLRRVTVCDCKTAGRRFDACRHTTVPELVMNPEVYRLWYDYRDAVERTGTKGSAESQQARHLLDDALWMLRDVTPQGGIQ